MAQTTEQYGDWPLKRLMTEAVGSGPKSAEDMTRNQATEAMARILDNEPDPTTLGAFWLANRWKRNTPDELAAYIDVMAEQSVALLPSLVKQSRRNYSIPPYASGYVPADSFRRDATGRC